jgi:hypothetical protein
MPWMYTSPHGPRRTLTSTVSESSGATIKRSRTTAACSGVTTVGQPAVTTMNPDRLARLFVELAESTESPLDAVRTFNKDYPRELAKIRAEVAVRRPGPLRAGGLYPVNGTQGIKLGYYCTPLTDGTIGYFQLRTDDCERASIATLAQVPIADVPDFKLYERMFAGLEPEEIDRAATLQMDQWLDKNGLTMTIHAVPPRTGRWIGVYRMPGHFNDHCVVLKDREVLFDCAALLPPNCNLLPVDERATDMIPDWMTDKDLTVDDLDYALTIE